MPYKHHENRRHKFTKAKYKVRNWPEYNDALRRRGDITLWFSAEAINAWHPAKSDGRGRPQKYSGMAIETAVFIRQVFHLPPTANRRLYEVTGSDLEVGDHHS